jgi:CheY-like chemotaxis protein
MRAPVPRPCHILVVDDHADSLDVIARVLRKLGHTTVCARNCAEARAAAAAERPGVVIGDVGLPDGNGVKLLGELKSDHGCATVAITGFTPSAVFGRGIPPGVDAYYVKPLDARTLQEAVGEFNHKPQSPAP